MSSKLLISSLLAIVLINAIEGVAIQPNGNIPSRLDDIACTTCIDAADYVHSHPDQSYDAVYAAMIIDCKRYAQYYFTCQDTLDRYLHVIYQRAQNPVVPSQSICYNLQLCHSKHPDPRNK